MKKFIVTMVSLLFLFIQESCRKEPICACNIENPQENLGWLSTLIKVTLNADIYQVKYNEVEYIVVCDLQNPDAMSIVFDCNGKKICEDGGIIVGAGICNFSDPENFWQYFYNNRRLIFKARNNPI